jgi:murein DD-endopeptidase MepM/ murein hydrolase activator NlpD
MPQVDVVAHIVEPGDTLSGIARRYGADVKQVVQANSGYLQDVNLIKVGWMLLIPIPRTDEPEPEPEPEPGDDYIEGWGYPTWRDEFDGPSIDTSKWTIHNNTWLGYDWGNITADNAFIDNGQLHLRVSQRDTPRVFSDGRQRWYDTAYLTGVGKFTAQYGRWEMRAKTNTTRGDSTGMWPGFWLRNSPSVGEIDIMESWGSPTTRPNTPYPAESSFFGAHESTSGDMQGFGGVNHDLLTGSSQPLTGADEFHTWAIEFTPTYLRVLYDGKHVRTYTPSGGGGTTAVPWMWGPTFTGNPWHIRLNVQMGDPYWTQNPNPTDTPNVVLPRDYIVDYIRYWPLPAT